MLVEKCQKIAISEFLKESRKQLKKYLLSSQLSAKQLEINLVPSKTGFGGTRLWFECPGCQKRVGVLYKNPLNGALGCRKCLGLDYRKRRFHKMAECAML
jgi:hypothetical protein